MNVAIITSSIQVGMLSTVIVMLPLSAHLTNIAAITDAGRSTYVVARRRSIICSITVSCMIIDFICSSTAVRRVVDSIVLVMMPFMTNPIKYSRI
jgi:hypothetical protein